MAEVVVEIRTPNGQKVGLFKSPTVEMLPAHHYFITGRFFEPDGTAAARVEFNPQVLPYEADISAVTRCEHKKLVGVYVQKGRQPVRMVGVCES